MQILSSETGAQKVNYTHNNTIYNTAFALVNRVDGNKIPIDFRFLNLANHIVKEYLVPDWQNKIDAIMDDFPELYEVDLMLHCWNSKWSQEKCAKKCK